MHVSTGVIGTQWLMRLLTKMQRSDIAYTLASNKSYPSWGYMAENGATTIWELWNGNTASPQMNSQNHVMLLGDLLIWLFEDVAGIRSSNELIGFKSVTMKPEKIDGLQYVRASYNGPYGNIQSEWRFSPDRQKFVWTIVIPANSYAVVHIPADDLNNVQLDAVPIKKHSDLISPEMRGGYAVILLGSGSYNFTSTFNYKKRHRPR